MTFMPGRFNPLDVLGVTGTLAALSIHDWLAALAGAVTIAAMLPLAYWRWRAILRERRAEKAAHSAPPGK
jgi:hypothetical protein